jgi:hypothetical protein
VSSEGYREISFLLAGRSELSILQERSITMDGLTVPLWINGKEETPGPTFDVISPQNNKLCWKAASASTEDAIRAVEAAQAAFPSWSKTKPAARQKILFKAADLLEARTAQSGLYMRTEMGTDVGASDYFVLPLSISMLRDIASHIPTITGSVPTLQDNGMSAMVWKEPYGVTLGITPWFVPELVSFLVEPLKLIQNIGMHLMSSVSAQRQQLLLLEIPLY